MKPDLPSWVDSVLQGITFWLGYKRQYYRGYHLTEGAIVGELTQLLYSNIENNKKVICEKMYKEIIEEWDGLHRLDLLIKDKEMAEGSEYNGMWKRNDGKIVFKCRECGNAMSIKTQSY